MVFTTASIVRTASSLILGLAAGASGADDSAFTDLDRRVLQELTAQHRAGQVVLHYRAEHLTAEQLDAAAEANAGAFRDLERLLEMKYEGDIHIFLYRDRGDLKERTQADAIAFGTGTRSIHQSHDFRGPHELCHIFAVQFPHGPDSFTDPFVVEGLATAVAESDQNVPIHSWATVYARARRLPPLWQFRWRWMENTPPGVHPYHVAASFVGYLIETHGIAKVKQWYVNATEAQAVLGQSFPDLERRWRRWLAARTVEPEHEQHVLARLGLGDAKIPEGLMAAGERLFDGQSLAGLDPELPACWQVRDGRLIGTHDGPWTSLSSHGQHAPLTAARVRFRLVSGDAFKVCIDPAGHSMREAIFARWSAYLTCEDGFTGNEGAPLDDSDWHEAVLVHSGGQWRAYLDGLRVLQCPAPAPTSDTRLTIAVERGVVEVSDFAALRP